MKIPENKVLFWLKTSCLSKPVDLLMEKNRKRDVPGAEGTYTRLINPLRMAYKAAWVRLFSPNLSSKELTYLATVFS